MKEYHVRGWRALEECRNEEQRSFSGISVQRNTGLRNGGKVECRGPPGSQESRNPGLIDGGNITQENKILVL